MQMTNFTWKLTKNVFFFSEFHTVKTHLQEPRVLEAILNR